MKHIFIVNPVAGQRNYKDELEEKIKNLSTPIDYIIALTKKDGGAKDVVKEFLVQYPDEKIVFYACGGDGTINEVASSVVNIKNVAMSVVPCGSGNDFVKYFGGSEKFLNLENLINGNEKPIDIMKIGDNYSINVCNFGFDAVVGKTANEVKEKGGKNPYGKGVVKAIFTGRKHKITVEVDGKVLNKKPYMLLCTLGNGCYVGGKYKCSPNAVVDDGLAEVCLVDKISLITFISMLKTYTLGKHLENMPKYMHYVRGKNIKLYSDKNFDICLDGEIVNGNNFNVQVLNNAINFIYPKE